MDSHSNNYQNREGRRKSLTKHTWYGSTQPARQKTEEEIRTELSVRLGKQQLNQGVNITLAAKSNHNLKHQETSLDTKSLTQDTHSVATSSSDLRDELKGRTSLPTSTSQIVLDGSTQTLSTMTTIGSETDSEIEYEAEAKKSPIGKQKTYLFHNAPIDPPAWLRDYRLNSNDISTSPPSLSTRASQLGHLNASPWRSPSSNTAKAATSPAPFGRRSSDFIHSSAPDRGRCTSMDWRREENRTRNCSDINRKDGDSKISNADLVSEKDVRKMSDDDIIKLVKDMAKREQPFACCTHGIRAGCTKCYGDGVTFTTSSIVSGESKKIDPRLEVIAKRLNVARNRKANYQGTITTFDILNSVTSEKDNTALYITRLPSVITIGEIYGHINHGAIHSSSLMLPHSSTHRYAAMRLVFMDRAGAEAFMDQTRSLEGLKIRGERIEAFWNREKVGPAGLELYKDMTRVLRIEAPSKDIDMKVILPLLEKSIRFDLVGKNQKIVHTKKGEEKKVIVLEFGSIRGQADSASLFLKQLRKGNAKRPNEMIISFERDPCDPRRDDLLQMPANTRETPLETPTASRSVWRPSPMQS